MHIRPILSALLQQKTRALLIAGQIALALAITSNALFIVSERMELMSRDLGVDVPNLLYLTSADLRSEPDFLDSVEADMRILRNLPGVLDASPIGSSPFGTGGNMECFMASEEPDSVEICFNRNKIDEHGLSTLGLELVAGRDFTAEDITFENVNDRGYASQAIVTQELADAWFPDGDGLGKSVFSDGLEVTITGIVAKMSSPWVRTEAKDRVMLQPTIREASTARYLVRAEPGERDGLMPKVEEALLAAQPERLLKVRTQEEMVGRTYRSDRSMVQILGVVVLLLIAVTAVGVIGLASSSVSQRTKQIGTRRALGARKRDILRYFLVENCIVAAFGTFAGCILSIAFNAWLVQEFSMSRLDLEWIGFAIFGIVAVSLLGTLPPARRATRVPPSIATRSV